MLEKKNLFKKNGTQDEIKYSEYIHHENIFFYPCSLEDFEGIYEVEYEQQLIETLKNIFKEENSKRVISSLIAQNKSEGSAF